MRALIISLALVGFLAAPVMADGGRCQPWESPDCNQNFKVKIKVYKFCYITADDNKIKFHLDDLNDNHGAVNARVGANFPFTLELTPDAQDDLDGGLFAIATGPGGDIGYKPGMKVETNPLNKWDPVTGGPIVMVSEPLSPGEYDVRVGAESNIRYTDDGDLALAGKYKGKMTLTITP